jgi:peptidyl-prolyl cis-trans isomerase B (cyclophilin B)
MRLTRVVPAAVLTIAMAAGLAAMTAGQKPAVPRIPAPNAPQLFTTPLTPDQLRGKQAVIDTSLGRIVVDLLPDQAPNHVGYFIKLAGEGAYNGTTFHRVIKYGIIQGGDPISKDPAKRALYGTGGLSVLKAEPGAGSHVRGAVSAVLLPGRRDSAGSQFFICISPQPALDGQFTVFGSVSEGIAVAAQISEAAVDEGGRTLDRIAIQSVTIRDIPSSDAEPFLTESPAALAAYRAILETSLGNITLEFLPDKAPNTVRHFLRLAAAGVIDHTSFHRVVPDFVIQGGYLGSRTLPFDAKQLALAKPIQPEFNDTPHDKGIVSMARGDDPASATTSFFIVTARASSLDGKYTAFGRVVDGMSVVDAIEQTPRDGEAPKVRIELIRIRIEKRP